MDLLGLVNVSKSGIYKIQKLKKRAVGAFELSNRYYEQ